MHAFAAGGQSVGRAIAIKVVMPMRVHAIEFAIQHGRHPAIRLRILGNGERGQSQTGPTFRSQQRRDDQLRLPGSEHVGKPHAMRRDFCPDRMHLPLLIQRRSARQPMQRATIGFDPSGTNREVDLAIAINVLSGNADVIQRRLILDDDALLPARVLIPQHSVLSDDNDVRLLVAIDVGERDRIANLPGERVDDLLGE